jgi:hypothetical protein
MNGTHWTEQDFIYHFYGIGPDAAHLDGCAECRARWDAWSARRSAVVPEQHVSPEFLAEQRRSIHRRLESDPRRRRALVPSFAATFAILLALILLRPETEEPFNPLLISAADSQLFAEIYEMEESSEPHAVLAMQALFEE